MSHLHLPDGVLPLWLWLAGYLLTIGLLTVLWRWKRADIDTRRFALLGLFAALMILAMSLELPPLPYHMNLSVVVAIVLGPALGIVAAFIANFFLALLGHGGVTVVGLNTLVVAVEMLVGAGVFRALLRLRARLSAAAGLAVVLGLASGTAASFGVIVVAAPAIDRTLAIGSRQTEEAHEPVTVAMQGGRLNLPRLAAFMFGLGAIGWVLEAVLSIAILTSLNRVYPQLVSRRE